MIQKPLKYQDNLTSDRLITRFLTEEDVLQWTEFFESKEATKLFPDFGLNTPHEKSSFWISKQLERYKENRLGLQSLIDKKTNIIIGQAGLLLQNVDGIGELEVGYHIKEKYWGNGYAPEAAKLFIDYAFKHNLSDSIISIIDIRNDNSIRVAEKNGLILDKTTIWNNLKVHVFRLRRK